MYNNEYVEILTILKLADGYETTIKLHVNLMPVDKWIELQTTDYCKTVTFKGNHVFLRNH